MRLALFAVSFAFAFLIVALVAALFIQAGIVGLTESLL